ncbi:MAG TPA: hypothetical protein VGF29_00585 [Hyphomicrobiaceae bacterium]
MPAMGGMGEPEGELITGVYAALLGAGDWQSWLDRLSRQLPNGKALLLYHDMAGGDGALSLHANFDPAAVVQYNKHYARKNPWQSKASTRPIGISARAEQMLPRDELVRTEFYCDFLRPQGIDTGVGLTIYREHARNFMVSVLSASVEDAEADRARALLGGLAPHLRRVFAHYRGEGRIAEAPPAVGAATEALGVPCVAVGLGRRVRWTNAAGREMLSRGDPVGADGLGRMTARNARILEAVDAALNAAMRGESIGKRAISLPCHGDAEPATRVTLVLPTLGPFEHYFAGPSVLLLVERPKRCALPSEVALQQAFGLTPAEARLALALAGGATVGSAAASLRISTETARTQLKGIFAKMEVHRQAELVAGIYRLGTLSQR